MSKKPAKNLNKIKSDDSATDRLMMAIIYIAFGLFAFICVYPFYYIFINTISANDLSANGEILFLSAPNPFS